LGIVTSSARCKYQIPQLGAQEGERKRGEEEDMLAKSVDKNCKLYLNIS
jgi:hypothetical protein